MACLFHVLYFLGFHHESKYIGHKIFESKQEVFKVYYVLFSSFFKVFAFLGFLAIATALPNPETRGSSCGMYNFSSY